MSETLEQLLEVGRATILDIAALKTEFEEPQVCFHFFCPSDEKQDRWGEDAECVRLSKPIFDAMPFELLVDGVGGCVGIEAWEKVQPTDAWLEDRLPRMLEVSQKAEMNFLGWSFEPKGGRIFSAGVEVMSASGSEGSASIDGLIESLKATKH